MFNLFWHIVRLSFQQQLTYRAAILAGLATNVFFGLLRAFVIIALYQGRAEVNGLSLQGAITTVAFSQAMIAILNVFGWWDMMTSVYSGEVGADLLKPMHLFPFWMARELGRALVNLVGRGLFLMVILSLFFSLHVPTALPQWLALVVSLSLGWLVSFAWRFLVNLAAFWSPDARGYGRIAFTLSMLFCGFLMPMRLYPDWFIAICNLTPFPSLFNTSIEVYLGLLTGQELAMALLTQGVWFVILAVAAQLVLAAGVRRLVVQGG